MMIEDFERNQSTSIPPPIPTEPDHVVQEISVPSRSLSSIPVELKEMIVWWVDYLSQRKFCDPEHPQDLANIRSLASVDRVFYQLCCRYIFVRFDLMNQPVKKLINALPIVQKHSEHARSLVWRLSHAELYDESKLRKPIEEPETWNEDTKSQWDLETRSELLLKILQACPRIEELDIDLDPFEYITEDTSPDKASFMWSYDHNMMNKFIQPICQLSSIVELRLISPRERPYFNETLIAKIISNLRQLQKFWANRISAVDRDTLTDPDAFQSPLGLQLASLPDLTWLFLDSIDCLDDSWTQLAWKCELEDLSFANCVGVTIGFLQAFTKLFASSLTELGFYSLDLNGGEDWTDDTISDALLGGELTFELPNLEILRDTRSLPMGLLEAFEASKNITELDLVETPMLHKSDIAALLQTEMWPNLEELSVWHSEAFESESDIDELMQLAEGYGIEARLRRIPLQS